MPRLSMSGSSVMLLPWQNALEIALGLGYDAFEIFGEFPQCVCAEVSAADREKARETIARNNIGLAVHAPFTSLNIAAFNPGARAESVKQYMDAVDLCADLGGSSVIVHNGEYVFSDHTRAKVPQAGTLQWGFNIDALKRVLERARSRGVNLCLENIGFEPEHMDRNVDDMLKIRSEVGDDLAFCIDIGHARLNGELPAVIAKMGPHARHIHFTDNFGKKDDHLPIGDGDFDYSTHLGFFRAFPHLITLEVVTIAVDPEPARKSLAFCRKLLGG